ncbi:MAG TPA: radical SAM protein [Syntrophales bacterium]|nr:radical SAM protein [Syntrophales bacterium]
MKYEGDIIRPPSEASSMLLQVTVGCSHNKCSFCPAYKEKRFRIKSHDEIEEDVLEASRWRPIERVFLCDGDALIIPHERLGKILDLIRQNIGGVKRIGTYANAKSILRKTVPELIELKDRGLGIVYLGIETGRDELLAKIRKGVNVSQMTEAGRRIKDAGIPLSVTVILGLGGVEHSLDHAEDTAKILSDIDPEYASALTLMLMPGTPMYSEYESGHFVLPDKFALLSELGVIIEKSSFNNCLFTSNHASNYLPIRAHLPQEKDKTLLKINDTIKKNDVKSLRPEFMRGF